MSAQEMIDTAKAMVAKGKGILAADESNGTCNKRFSKLGIDTTEENRRAYREMLLTTPKLSEHISGAILYDETIRQSSKDGKKFTKVMTDAGMIPGIKVDTGAKPLAGFPNEKVTEGLDGLRDRIAEYYEMGARFAKWRAVITIGDGIPTDACIEANAHALARYAALCQEGGLVPIVEPEVLMNGNHTIERSFEVTSKTLRTVFNQLALLNVEFDKMVLKPSMVISGDECPQQASVEEVAAATLKCLMDNVPATVPGIAFLSGGQSNEVATQHLNAMNKMAENAPWNLTFSYGRALQQPALTTWKAQQSNVPDAQKALFHRAKCNGAATKGEYSAQMEKEMVTA